MLEDLIIETEPIDTSNLSEEEKLVIDHLESIEIIRFDLTRNDIGFCDKDDELRNWWILKNNKFVYSYRKIYEILEDKYHYNEQEINDLVKHILSKYYKIRIATTHSYAFYLNWILLKILQK